MRRYAAGACTRADSQVASFTLFLGEPTLAAAGVQVEGLTFSHPTAARPSEWSCTSPSNNAQETRIEAGLNRRKINVAAPDLGITDTSRLLQVLKGDTKAIFSAASLATRTVDYLNDLQPKPDPAPDPGDGTGPREPERPPKPGIATATSKPAGPR